MLVEGQWIDDRANLLICGPSGVGKELARLGARQPAATIDPCSISAFLGCSPISLWRPATAATPRILRALGRVDLLILDDWGLEPLDAAARHDLWRS